MGDLETLTAAASAKHYQKIDIRSVVIVAILAFAGGAYVGVGHDVASAKAAPAQVSTPATSVVVASK